MRNVVKTIAKNAAAGAAVGGSLLFTAGLGIATAQPDTTTQDGLVNVAIGDVGVLEDVNVAAAAQIAAAVCDVEVGPVNVLADSVDVNGGQQTVCTNNLGPVDIQQNGPGQSENAPGQAGETPTTETPTPTDTPAEEPADGEN